MATGPSTLTKAYRLSKALGMDIIPNPNPRNTENSRMNRNILYNMGKDINIVKQNIIMLVKLQGGSPATRAAEYFKSNKVHQLATSKSLNPLQVTKTGEKKSEGSGLFSNIFGKILKGGLLIGIVGALGNFFKGEDGKEFLKSVFKFIMKGLENVTEMFKDTVSELANDKEFLASVKNIFINIFDFFVESTKSVKNLISDLMKNDKFTQKLSDIIVNIIGALSQFVQGAGKTLEKTLNNKEFFESVTNIFTSVMSLLSTVAGKLKDLFENQKFQEEFKKLTKELIGTVVSAYKLAFESISKGLQSELGMGETSANLVSAGILGAVTDLKIFDSKITALIVSTGLGILSLVGLALSSRFLSARVATAAAAAAGAAISAALANGGLNPTGPTPTPTPRPTPTPGPTPTPTPGPTPTPTPGPTPTPTPGPTPTPTPKPTLNPKSQALFQKWGTAPAVEEVAAGATKTGAKFVGAARTGAKFIPLAGEALMVAEMGYGVLSNRSEYIKAVSEVEKDYLDDKFNEDTLLAKLCALQMLHHRQDADTILQFDDGREETVRIDKNNVLEILKKIKKLKEQKDSNKKTPISTTFEIPTNPFTFSSNKPFKFESVNIPTFTPPTQVKEVETKTNTNTPQITPENFNEKFTPEQINQGKIAMEYFKSQGWTHDQAAAIVGNLFRESRFVSIAHNKDENAQGLAQWRGPRQTAFKELIGKDILDASFEDQLKFVNHELNKRPEGKKLREMSDIIDATKLVQSQYEVSKGGKEDVDKRIFYAKFFGGMPQDAGKFSVPTPEEPKKELSLFDQIANSLKTFSATIFGNKKPEDVAKDMFDSLAKGFDIVKSELKTSGVDLDEWTRDIIRTRENQEQAPIVINNQPAQTPQAPSGASQPSFAPAGVVDVDFIKILVDMNSEYVFKM